MQALNALLFQQHATLHSSHRCTLQSLVIHLCHGLVKIILFLLWLKYNPSLIMTEVAFSCFDVLTSLLSSVHPWEDHLMLSFWKIPHSYDFGSFLPLYVLPLSKLLPAYFLLFRLILNQTGKAAGLLAQFLNLLFHILPMTFFSWSLWKHHSITQAYSVGVVDSISSDMTLVDSALPAES